MRRQRNGGETGMKRTRAMAPLMLAALAACQAKPEPLTVTVPGYPEVVNMPAKRMTGTLTLGFEISRFNQCWFDMTRAASARFQRIAPEASGRGPHRYRVVMFAMRTPSSDPAIQYGHLGMYPCQILATRFLSVKRTRYRP